MKLLPSLLAGTAFAVAALSPALANQELAQKKACMACHGMDKKIVGPGYLEVSRAAAYLANAGGAKFAEPAAPAAAASEASAPASDAK